MTSPVREGRIPILKLYENLIVVVQGALTDQQVSQLKEEIPRALERYEVDGLVINVAGVDILDSYITRMIYDVAIASRLMGVDTVVCGMSSLVVVTLVEMGLGMGIVPTALNLERALEMLAARRRARLKVVSEDDSAGEDGGEAAPASRPIGSV